MTSTVPDDSRQPRCQGVFAILCTAFASAGRLDLPTLEGERLRISRRPHHGLERANGRRPSVRRASIFAIASATQLRGISAGVYCSNFRSEASSSLRYLFARICFHSIGI